MLYHPNGANYLFKYPDVFTAKKYRFSPEAGIELDLWEVKSKKKQSNHCVLQVHGNAQNASAHIQSLFWMVDKAGFTAYSFDYRSYGQSTGSPSPENTVSDAIKIIEHVAKLCDGKKLTLLGQSLGGAVLMRALAEYPGKLPAHNVIIDSSFLSYRRISVDVLSRMWLTWPFQWLGWFLMSDGWAPIRTVEKLPDVPILVIHGTKDEVIPYWFGEDLFSRLTMPRKKFLSVPGARHTEGFFFDKGKHQPEVLEWMGAKNN